MAKDTGQLVCSAIMHTCSIPARGGLVSVIGLLHGEEVQALLVVSCAEQGGLPLGGPAVL